MKTILHFLLSAALCVASLAATGCSAEEIRVTLNGQPLTFDVAPQLTDDRVLVPLRKIFEELGALVKWDEETQTVTARKNKKTVTLTVGESEMTVDTGKTDDSGNPVIQTVSLDVPAQIVQNRTLVPLRAISEAFGMTVTWEEPEVTITKEETADDSWKENVGAVNLSDGTATGEGITMEEEQITFTQGGISLSPAAFTEPSL